MTSTMGSEQDIVKRDLDGVADKPDPNGLSRVAIADPVASPGEAHRAMGSTMRSTSPPLVGTAGVAALARRFILASSSMR
jgi:hypothetical protein